LAQSSKRTNQSIQTTKKKKKKSIYNNQTLGKKKKVLTQTSTLTTLQKSSTFLKTPQKTRMSICAFVSRGPGAKKNLPYKPIHKKQFLKHF
jgi:hypothetical protein